MESRRLREGYTRATNQREWANADVVAATFSHDSDALEAAHLSHEQALRAWESARITLLKHLATHNESGLPDEAPPDNPAAGFLADDWRHRLRKAREHLSAAQKKVKEVLTEHPLSDTYSSDGNYALSQALRNENLALAEYRRVLRIFTDLVVYGNSPEDKK